MLTFKKQGNSECLATALWQLGAIGEAEVRHYAKNVLPLTFQSFSPVDIQSNWLGELGFEKMKQWMDEEIRKPDGAFYGDAFGSRSIPFPETGRGLLLVRLRNWSGGSGQHALSVEDGMIMDSNGPGKLETAAEYKERIARDQHAEIEWTYFEPIPERAASGA